MAKTGDPDNLGEKSVGILPTLDYFQKTYAGTMDGADQKAVGVFKSYESQEKLRRLQAELIWIKDGKVTSAACDRLVGRKRKAKHGSYTRWAELMLLWITQHKK